jgi:hypothetical protein
MKAEEARKAADAVKSSEIDEVLKEIKQKSNDGEYKAYFYKHLNDFTVKELKKLGFGYTSSFDRNEILVTISW